MGHHSSRLHPRHAATQPHSHTATQPPPPLLAIPVPYCLQIAPSTLLLLALPRPKAPTSTFPHEYRDMHFVICSIPIPPRPPPCGIQETRTPRQLELELELGIPSTPRPPPLPTYGIIGLPEHPTDIPTNIPTHFLHALPHIHSTFLPLVSKPNPSLNHHQLLAAASR